MMKAALGRRTAGLQFHVCQISLANRFYSNSASNLANVMDEERANIVELQRNLGIAKLEDWYRVSKKRVILKGGAQILSKFNSVEDMLKFFYPQFEWNRALFLASKKRAARGYWKDLSAQRQALEAIGKELGIEQLSDWYSVSRQDLIKKGGRKVLDRYSSFAEALRTLYPDFAWDSSKFLSGSNSSRGYWQDLTHQRKLMDDIAKALDIKEPSGWYKVTRREVTERGGSHLFRFYSSLEDLLQTVYPEVQWQQHRFAEAERSPPNYWADINNQRELLDLIGQELDVKEMSDWYSVPLRDIMKKGGWRFMRYYGSSLPDALKAIYPEYPWQPSRFSKASSYLSGFWSDLENQKQFLERISKELGIAQLSDWYGITRRDIAERGGSNLFTYHASLEAALRVIYPEHPWDSNKFKELSRTPPGHWIDKSNVMAALDKAEAALGIHQPEDWYTVTLVDLKQVGFPTTYNKLQIASLLAEKYPNFKWEKVFLLKGRYAQQKRLEKAVLSLFPGVDIKTNVRSEAALVNPETGYYVELDILLPSLNLAFEFQEKHHFVGSDFLYVPVEVIKTRDNAKKKLAANKGLTLIIVPCWWDGKLESLVATIKRDRPELLPDVNLKGEAIPEAIPEGFFDKAVPKIEDIGEPTNAGFFTLSNVDPTHWWIFEKYDGVRGFWNPLKKTFYSRKGNRFFVPQEIIDAMPKDIFLDGEIWFGHENFEEASRMANTIDASMVDWSKFKYMVFDVPTMTNEPYEKRYNYLVERLKTENCEYVEIARKEECKGIQHLEMFFQDVLDRGGEGVILRDPLAPLQPGRSPGYLKHKKFRDAEAKVVCKVGPYQWECEMPNGVTFVASAGTTEFVKRWDPQPGDIVSFKHRGYLMATKKPKFPTLYRMRKDLTWQDVINNWKEKKVNITGYKPLKKSGKQHKKKGYWLKIENRRKFFIEFANETGFNPFDAESWSKVTQSQIIEKKGKGPMRSAISLKKALESTFPELQLNITEHRKKNVWKDIKNCRQWFEEFAKERSFDPLDAENWYGIEQDQFLKKRGAMGPAQEHGGFRNALIAAYPELHFDAWEFAAKKKKQRKPSKWQDVNVCREFFNSYAQSKGFDPLVAENWYACPLEDLLKIKGGLSIQRVNKGFKNALVKAFPETTFTRWA